MRSATTARTSDPLPPPERLILREDLPGKGRGVFALDAFRPGEEVLEFLGHVRDVSTYTDLTHALQVGPTDFLSASGGIDDYVNHSCSPNTGIRDDKGRIVLIALKAIAPGAEITFDYSTTQTNGLWSMECQCGSKKCRGRILDFKDLPQELRNFYEKNNAVLPFVLADSKK